MSGPFVFTGGAGKDRLTADEMHLLESGSGPWRVSVRSPLFRPPTDVYETEEAIVVRVEIAGMREEEFSIELDDRLLSIRGIRPDVTERRAYHQMEIRFGEFSVELELPARISAHLVAAVYKDGFLQVTLPKAQPIQIQVD